MGFYNSVYMTVGLKIPRQYEKGIRQITKCENNHYIQHGKFCGKCGKPFKTYDEPFNYAFDYQEFFSGHGLSCNITREDYEIVNSNIIEDINLEETDIFTVDTKKVEVMKETFRTTHKEGIKKVEELVGHKLKVEFFVIWDYS